LRRKKQQELLEDLFRLDKGEETSSELELDLDNDFTSDDTGESDGESDDKENNGDDENAEKKRNTKKGKRRSKVMTKQNDLWKNHSKNQKMSIRLMFLNIKRQLVTLYLIVN